MCKTEKLNFIEKVADLLLKYCPQMSDSVRYWVACQFALESNYGNSRIAKTRNNYCGMKVPYARLSLNQQATGFASFSSLEECVIDYCYWLAWNKFQSDQLFNLDLFTRRIIASKYCPDSDYVDRVYSIYNQLN